MAYCGRCGSQVVGRFCGSCGEPAAGQAEVSQPGAGPTAWGGPQPWAASSGPQAPVQPVAANSPVSPVPGTVGGGSGYPPFAPPPPPPPPPSRSNAGVVWLTVAVVVVALVIGFLVYRGQSQSTATPSPTVATPTDEATPSTPDDETSEPSTPPPDAPTVKPATALAQQRAQDLGSVVFDGRWIAQLASKYDGVVDRSQTAASGGHTFRLADILAEHQALRSRFESQGVSVLLLRATDFGRQRNWGRTIWVTVADPGADSVEQARQWCRRSFPNRTKKQVENVCLPRQLKAPY